MKKKLELVMACCIAVLMSSCGTKQISPTAGLSGEKLVWSSHDKRPEWTVKEPMGSDGVLKFVGLSGKAASEKSAREDAMRNATGNVVKYIGTLVEEKFQNITTSSGLDSEIVDPTKVARSIEEQLTGAFARRVKAEEWYIEQRQNEKMQENWYIVYVLAQIPETSISQAYDETMDSNIDELKAKRDAANDVKAKQQFQNAMDAFEQAKQAGFTVR